MTESADGDIAVRDHQWRSILKTISWRVIATGTTTSLVYLFTGKLHLAIEVGLLEVVLKLLFYYLHERGWESIAWGQMEHPLASLPVKRPLQPKDRRIIEHRLKELGYL
ncbi:MAG: DUF2061 domain-containing protein [Anaerolineae bacterium]